MSTVTKPIFNSLGSNYNWNFVITAVRQLVWTQEKALTELKTQLSRQFGGQVTLVYKGRDAIEYGLRQAGIGKGDEVIIQAFSCYAIEEAIVRAGARPIFADLEKNQLNPTVRTLELALKTAPHAKAVLIQHTLGIPAQISEIKAWCTHHHLVLIEDLAQAVGGMDEESKSLGKYGDILIFSFGRDKMIDAVAGGACIVKPPFETKSSSVVLSLNFPRFLLWKEMTYPLLTFIIRRTHLWGLGKFIFQLAKKSGWFLSPIKTQLPAITQLPSEYAMLALAQLQTFSVQLQHRLEIALVYDQNLEWKQGQCQQLEPSNFLTKSSHVRYSIWVDDPSALIQFLQARQIYISDRWYRQPVDCGSLGCKSAYIPGSCPEAEQLAAHIINLPTHQSVTTADALRVCEAITQYFESKES